MVSQGLPEPYYDKDGITIYCGDCLEVVPQLNADVLLTDPVWPNAHPDLKGSENPQQLFDSFLHIWRVAAIKRRRKGVAGRGKRYEQTKPAC